MEIKKNDKKLMKFLGRVAITTAVSAVLSPPVALYLSSVTYGTAKCLEYLVEEEDQEACRFISDCASDVVTGGLFNCVIGTKAISLTSETTHSIGQLASEEIAQNGMTEFAKELINAGKEISELQKDFEFINNIKEKILISKELIKHKNHLDNNLDYLESCEICKS